MFYQRWRQVVAERREKLALRDLSSGAAQWTFGELEAQAAAVPLTAGPVAFARDTGARFIFAVLEAWRRNQVVCPLEPTQEAALLDSLPPGCAHLKTTSATTGAPRLVLFSAAQLMADAENIVATMGLRPEWPNLGVISLAHSYGFSNLVLPLLLYGIPLTLVGSALPEAVRRAAALERDVTLPAVPALWGRWAEAGTIPSNIRLAISAGAPLPIKLEQTIFERHGLKIHNFYGSTECGGIAYDRSMEPRSEASCAGASMENVEVSVNSEGCLEVRGRAVGLTYWPEPNPNLQAGTFRTSDLAEIRDGKVYLLGRASDQINIAGRKVLPETIEEVLAAHPQVRECVAFGVPSAQAERGETIVACLAVSGEVTSADLKNFMMAKLPAWQVPREWRFVESVAANHRGKLSRSEWRKRYLEGLM